MQRVVHPPTDRNAEERQEVARERGFGDRYEHIYTVKNDQTPGDSSVFRFYATHGPRRSPVTGSIHGVVEGPSAIQKRKIRDERRPRKEK